MFFNEQKEEFDQGLEKMLAGDLTGTGLAHFLRDHHRHISLINSLFIAPVLHKVYEQGRLEDAKILMSYGADPDASNMKNKETLLHLILTKSYPTQKNTPEEVLDFLNAVLVCYGANPNAETDEGFTPLHELYLLPEPLQPLAKEIVLRFVRSGAKLDVEDFTTGYTPTNALPQFAKWKDKNWVQEVAKFLALGREGVLAWDVERILSGELDQEIKKSPSSPPKKM